MKIKELENKHMGSMAFIVGAGPSLHFQDISELKNYVTISVNSGILKIPECDYFISDDIGVKNWNYYHEEAAKNNCIKLLYYDKLHEHVNHFKKEEVIFFKHKWWFDAKNNNKNLDGLNMTKDAELPIIGARTSSGSALHFAYIMGCNPIVLLGCDACYHGRKRYFWQYPGEKKAFRYTGEEVYSNPNHGFINNKPVDAHCLEFNSYWEELVEKNKDKVDIIYASEGGIINCFTTMTLENVITKYKDLKK